MAFTLPYDDDPNIGETERAKRRKLAPRGTGTGTPGIEEGGVYRPGSTFAQGMRGGQQQPGTGNVLGMPPQPNFIDRAKTAVINTAQGMNNMVDAGQSALASVQRPDVAPASPPEGAASRRVRAIADQSRADLAAQAGMPTPTTRAPLPVTQAAPAGYQPGQAFAQNMQQTPAVMPSPAVAMQPVQPEAPYTPPAYIRAAQASNDMVDAVQNAFTPAPQQQIAQPPVATADNAVMYQQPRPPTEPARSRSGPITDSPVTYAGAPAVLAGPGRAAGAIGGPAPEGVMPDSGQQLAQAPIDTTRPMVPAGGGKFSTEVTIGIEADGKHFNIPTIVNGQQVDKDTAIQLWQQGKNPEVGVFATRAEADAAAGQRSNAIGQLRGEEFAANSQPSMSRGSIAPANVNWNHRAMEDRAPVTDDSFRGSSVAVPRKTQDQVAANANPTASIGSAPGGQLARLQAQSLSTLDNSSSVNDAERMNAPWHTEYTRMMAEKKLADAAQAQFFTDEAQRNQRAANGPSYRELEIAKGEKRFADMQGMGKRGAAANLDSIQKAYSEANAPAVRRDYQAEAIARGHAADTRATAAQDAAQKDKANPLAIAKGLQDISTARTAEDTARITQRGAEQGIAEKKLHLDTVTELHDPNITPQRRTQLIGLLLGMAGKDVGDWKAHPVRRTDDLGHINDSVVLINDRTGETRVISGEPQGQAIGAPAGAAHPLEGKVVMGNPGTKYAGQYGTIINGEFVPNKKS